ncbi:MAG: hypothetical protein HYW08_09945 [candidate division NC10 bacterium]|nr:hypothetical protein [candidate division NC10 bacterium]
MPDSPNKRMRLARKRKKLQEKAERKRVRKEGQKAGTGEVIPVRLEDIFGPGLPPAPKDS